jgi:chromosomal replication initiator protein
MERWQRARNALRTSLGASNYDAWIEPLRLVEENGPHVVLSAPNKFCRDWVQAKFIEELRLSLTDEGAGRPEIVFRVDPTQGELFAVPAEEPKPKNGARPRLGNLVARYTFDNFVVGPSNQFAHAAARAVAKRPGEQYNPLFIYGWVGIGKTHLVNAIGHSVLARNPLARVAYLSSESFVNDLISSLRRDRMDDFKNRFRKVDVLILDDVQFLAGRERTQEEFFHTFNCLHEAHKQIVLTSDKFPKEIPDLEERLRNRFEWGLTADIQTPEMETRLAIVLKKAEEEGVSLPADVAEFMASEVATNVRELEGAFTRLAALSSLQNAPITVDFARHVLTPHLRGIAQARITVEEVQRAVCAHLGITENEMNSKRRTQNLVTARHMAMFLCRKLVSASYPEIGAKFGHRDHSTVIHAHKVMNRRIGQEPSLRDAAQAIERTLLKR